MKFPLVKLAAAFAISAAPVVATAQSNPPIKTVEATGSFLCVGGSPENGQATLISENNMPAITVLVGPTATGSYVPPKNVTIDQSFTLGQYAEAATDAFTAYANKQCMSQLYRALQSPNVPSVINISAEDVVLAFAFK